VRRGVRNRLDDAFEPHCKRFEAEEALKARPWARRKTMAGVNVVVAIVLLLFAYIYGTTMALVVVPWLSFSVPGVVHAGVLSFTTFMALLCYLKCVYGDPGFSSVDWLPEQEDGAVGTHVKKSGGPRQCRKCIPPRYKPPRAHHCKECKRCVLRMDHHCMWVNNCLGHANYKSFVLFLLYVLSACVHCLVLTMSYTIYSMHSRHREKTALRAATRLTENPQSAILTSGYYVVVSSVLQMFCVSMLMPLCIALAILFGWHVYLVSRNLTTIEFYEGVTVLENQQEGACRLKRHLYDLGFLRNVQQVLGTHPSRWFFPGKGTMMGDGLAFPTFVDMCRKRTGSTHGVLESDA